MSSPLGKRHPPHSKALAHSKFLTSEQLVIVESEPQSTGWTGDQLAPRLPGFELPPAAAQGGRHGFELRGLGPRLLLTDKNNSNSFPQINVTSFHEILSRIISRHLIPTISVCNVYLTRESSFIAPTPSPFLLVTPPNTSNMSVPLLFTIFSLSLDREPRSVLWKHIVEYILKNKMVFVC